MCNITASKRTNREGGSGSLERRDRVGGVVGKTHATAKPKLKNHLINKAAKKLKSSNNSGNSSNSPTSGATPCFDWFVSSCHEFPQCHLPHTRLLHVLTTQLLAYSNCRPLSLSPPVSPPFFVSFEHFLMPIVDFLKQNKRKSKQGKGRQPEKERQPVRLHQQKGTLPASSCATQMPQRNSAEIIAKCGNMIKKVKRMELKQSFGKCC